MLVENFENSGPEKTSPSGDAVDEAEPVEGSTEEALRTLPAVLPASTVNGCRRRISQCRN